jgi:uncharacterized protein
MTNRLAAEKSLYLRKHGTNPIDWLPWGPEALAKAADENKPIFVSIGYSSCHWCTVMEGEAFSDQEIADFLNTYYVAIKVDREERPDIDAIYMQALQLMNEQGGWPLNIFLTPGDLVPFYGGTYFPRSDRYGRPGFMKVLTAIHDYYQTKGEELAKHKTRILDALLATTRLQPGTAFSKDLLQKGGDQIRSILGRDSTGPSFPMIPYASFALRVSRFGDAELADLAANRGEDLALGGIYDHMGGGFHRYTVDGTWTVPHFEKMLYDNGQILEFLADLWAAGIQEPAFERAISGTFDWLTREMTDARGYFYGSQDADSEGEEGKFYVWTHEELETLLGVEERKRLEDQFFVTPKGNFEGKIVLQRRKGGLLDTETEKCLAQLFAVRKNRIPPATDTKLVVAWNALVISGLARASEVFDDEEYLDTAAQAAEFILANQWTGEVFYRVNYDGTPAIPAKAEDFALFIKALLDLHRATQATHWLDGAITLQKAMDEQLGDIESGGYFSAAASPDLLIREKEYQDNATPAANGIAAANLVRLFLLTDNPAYLEQSERVLKQFSQLLEQAPRACPSLLAGYDWLTHQTLVRADRERISKLTQGYWPTAQFKAEAVVPPAVALICQGLQCLQPAKTDSEIEEQLRSSLVRVQF